MRIVRSDPSERLEKERWHHKDAPSNMEVVSQPSCDPRVLHNEACSPFIYVSFKSPTRSEAMFSFWLCHHGNRAASFSSLHVMATFLGLLREWLSPSPLPALAGSKAQIPPYYFRIRPVHVRDTILFLS